MCSKRLLIVDDEPGFGEFARKVATNLGYEVEVTIGGSAFKERFESFRPNVALIDIVMPGIDGVELVQWLAKRGAQSLRLIVVTGYSSDYARHTKMLGEAMGLDSISVLTKPVAVATLRRTFEAGQAA